MRWTTAKKWFLNTFLLISLSFLPSIGWEGLAQAPEEEVIATLDGRPIYRSEIEQNMSFQVYRLQGSIYSLLQKGTEELVIQRLLGAEAARQGLNPEALLKKEVQDKVVPPSENEVEEYVAGHLEEGGKGPERRSRIRTYLYQRALARRKLDFVATLRQKAEFHFLLKPPERPRVKVAIEGRPWRGNPDALVTLVHYASFNSKLCVESVEKIRKLMNEFPGQIKWVHRNYLAIQDSKALFAAEIGESAEEQGIFWKVHDRMFTRHGDFELRDIREIARDTGLDLEKFERGQKEGRYLLKVKEDIGDAVKIGFEGGPVIFVNGIYFSGTLSYEELKNLVQKDLERIRALKEGKK